MLAGCTTGFDREWKSAAATRQSDPFAGRWEGSWLSQKHRKAGGRLQCVLTPADAVHYRAAFKAHWLIFTSSYATVFQAEHRDGELRFRGSENLGAIFGGTYTFEGRATPRHFSAKYDSSYDHGVFEMARVAGERR
jgi:hypothetical protein